MQTDLDLHCLQEQLNSLPNNKILDVTKLKAFAEDRIDLAQMMISVFNRIENIVGEGENAGYQHFLLFPQCFRKVFFLGSLAEPYISVSSLADFRTEGR